MAGESARFGVSEARWSLYPMAGSAVRLRRQIPYTVAAEILLTGKHVTAAEALQMGLIGHVVPDGSALAKAKEIATVIADNGPLLFPAIKQLLRHTEMVPEHEAFELHDSLDAVQRVIRSDDLKEGTRAFTEKRKPQFRRR